MDIQILIPLCFIGLALLAQVIAVAVPAPMGSRKRVAGVVFGVIGILLTVLAGLMTLWVR